MNIFLQLGEYSMKVIPNIGIFNALIRITCGLTIVSYFTSKLIRRPWNNSYIIMILLGAMKVAEGIVRYCPVTALFQEGQEKLGNINIKDLGLGNKSIKDFMDTFTNNNKLEDSVKNN